MSTRTNERIAELLKEQTYDQRIEMAKYLLDAAQSWLDESNELDADYFATLLGSFAEEAMPEENHE